MEKHLSVIFDGDLINVHTKGRERMNQINLAGMAPVLGWLKFFDAVWDDRLPALKSVHERISP